MMRKQWLAVAAKVVAALCLAGCATPQKVLMERTSSLVVYDLPAMEVMKAAEVVLGERGYALLPSTDPYFLQTTWVATGNFDMGTRWSRLFVEGRIRADGRFSVRAYEMAATTFARTQALPSALVHTSHGFIDDVPNGSPTVLLSEPELQARSARAAVRRELELEWAILEHVNPTFAGRVKEQVDLYVARAPR
ncbi:hypothetical protein MYSTI_04707 [Myxococcus stipitatus DSM 14675]|uniref:Lipoprotein n=1 Tax=Myxococcus stipitatus (strain DSM 14675 / JCM 12634 / Mx s8) TaxID=1278073 RepID=L7UHT0_MYXSD|nr:hypothetical protein [Myxococcus stipitatus]AGC45999.1 hypothetical protein MYSTI_04707 [Myxococcus stipitatus DSM 14675]